jgi:NTP pyrophosphatase (non-canonical NTP hydrolase)
MSDIKKLQKRVVEFRDARNWKQFHNPKDMAISLLLEATEFLEHFQWKSQEEIEQYLKSNKKDVADELADVLYWVMLLSHDLEIDIITQYEQKMQENEAKYPIEKAKGSNKKYSEL